MRYKFFLSLTVLLVFLFLPFIAKAQNTNPPGEKVRIEAKERVYQKQIEKADARIEIQKRVEDRKATQEAKLMEKKQERLKYYWGNLEKRFDATIERLEILITRIESRLVKITQENPEIDITKIEANIDSAKELLNDARNLLDKASDNFKSLLASEDQDTAFDALRETIREVKDLLIESHRLLVYIIGDIKGLRVGSKIVTPTVKITITPTPTTETKITPTVNSSPTTEPESTIEESSVVE